METPKNKIKIFVVISIIISILAFLVIIGWYILFPIYFAMNFVNPTGGHTDLPTKLHGQIVSKITDSLNNVKWKYNLPDERKKQLSSDINQGGYYYFFEKNDTLSVFWSEKLKSGGYRSGQKEEITRTIIIGIECYNVIFLDAVYTDSSKISYDEIPDKKREEYEKLLRQTVFKDIEKEAKRQNLPNSEIYLPKEILEKYGYYEFAKKIYPE